jgi:hypothetical protein
MITSIVTCLILAQCFHVILILLTTRSLVSLLDNYFIHGNEMAFPQSHCKLQRWEANVRLSVSKFHASSTTEHCFPKAELQMEIFVMATFYTVREHTRGQSTAC